MKKTSGKSHWKDSQNTWPVPLKTAKGIRTKANLRNCHHQEEAKEKWWLNVPRILDGILEKKKDTLGETKGIWTKDEL